MFIIKSVFGIACIMVLILFSGNSALAKEPIDINVTMQNNEKGDGIQRIMDVKNEEGELSINSFIIGKVGYFTLWSHIGSNDSLTLWKDLRIFKEKEISKIHLYMNSGGGSAFSGMGFSDQLRMARKTFDITIEASGLIASAAVPILACGGKRIASSNTIFMVHQGKLLKFFAVEGLRELDQQRRMMKMLEDRYLTLLANHSNLSKDEWKEMCKKETWFTAQQAKEYGIIDKIR